jgi:hypothetical protein
MALITADALTLNAREAETVSEAIFERVYNDSDISDTHEIETGIDMKTQIVFAGRIGLLGRASVGCTPNNEGGFTLSEKFWDPAREDFRLAHCAADMPALLKLFKKAQRMNPDFYDRVGSEEFGIIISAVEDAMLENLHRKIWFSDTAAAVAPGGNFKAGTNLAYWNTFNGLFKQIFADVTASRTPRVTIAANAGASYTAQKLGDDAAVSILADMTTSADERLIASEEAFFLVTRSISDNYRATLRNKTLGSGFMEVVENGRPKLYFDGIEVRTRYDWDRWIKGYQDNGTKYNLPNRAILTTKANIPVGTLSTEDLGKLEAFYDQKDKTNYIDAVYTIDTKHLEPYMTVAAY